METTKMDVGLHGWGVHPTVHLVIPKVHCFTRGLLYFNSTFFLSLYTSRSSTLLSKPLHHRAQPHTPLPLHPPPCNMPDDPSVEPTVPEDNTNSTPETPPAPPTGEPEPEPEAAAAAAAGETEGAVPAPASPTVKGAGGAGSSASPPGTPSGSAQKGVLVIPETTPASLARTLQECVPLVYKGHVSGVRSLLQQTLANGGEAALQELTSTTVQYHHVAGCLLHHAIYAHKKRVVALTFDYTETLACKTAALFFSCRFCKYDIALYLAARLGKEINAQREDGNSILHCVCSKSKPPVGFIAEICKLKILKVNAKNGLGLAPVHLLAQHATGIEGKDACIVLKAKGALLDLPSSSGVTAIQMTRNSYLRETLGLTSKERRRGNPLETLSEGELAEMDCLPISKLPKLKTIDIGAAKNTLSSSRDDPSTAASTVIRKKRIRGDEEAELVNRLYSVARAKQEEVTGNLSKRFLTTDRKVKRLSPMEQEDSVDRLFSQTRSGSDKVSALYSKYVLPIDTRTLPKEAIQDSVTRLYSVSLEKSKDKNDLLISKYLPASLVRQKCGGRKLTPGESTAANARLYDEAVQKQKSTMTKLKANYLQDRPKSTLTDAQWKETAQRLHTKS